MVLVDYGHPAAALYEPTRGSLLRAYVRHRVHDDPLANIGRQDLTAHVDLTAVERLAADAGLDPLGVTTPGGIPDRPGSGEMLVALQTDRRRSRRLPRGPSGLSPPPRSLCDRPVLGRPVGRGMGFEPPLRGLVFRMPARR